jgi:hypothetical protein
MPTIEEVEIEPHKTTVKADEYFESKSIHAALRYYAKAYSKEKSASKSSVFLTTWRNVTASRAV